MKVKDLLSELEKKFPLELQEKYDNTGKQIVFSEDKISNILISLDIDQDVLLEAEEKNCNLILTHHPYFFKPFSHIDSADPDSSIVIKLIQKKISLFALHTNLDKIFYNRAAEVIGLPPGEVIFKDSSIDNVETAGIGSVSQLDSPVTLSELNKIVKAKLNLEFIVFAGNPDSIIERVAVVNGAGGNSIQKIISKTNPSCIITGDVGYHHVKYAQRHDVSVIDAGHYGTEKILLDFLKKDVLDCLTNKPESEHIRLNISESEENPFHVFIDN